MEYVLNEKQLVMNFSEKFCKTEIEVINSACFADVWGRFIDHLYKTENQAFLGVLNIFPKKKVKKATIDLLKHLLVFSVEEVKEQDPFFCQALEKQDVLYDLVQEFYNNWRRIERYAVISTKAKMNSVESGAFIEAQTDFNNVILKTYRTICEKLYGAKFPIYRQLPAGVNAALLLSRNAWMGENSYYSFLAKSEAIEQIVIRPPFISYSAKNKRTGTYQEVFKNPCDAIKDKFKASEYYCYAAMVGSALTYVYFHRDYLAHGITICNLFEFVPLSEVKGKKPDCIYIFGCDIEGDSVFYHDKEEGIYVGVAPHNDSIDYFGYMKKMLLTLYNVSMIEQGNLPLHGACVHITMRSGETKNIVIIGDSGAGKSESLEALSEMAGDDISAQLTVFDDMGTFKRMPNGEILAFGTEIGAFVRLDDMTSGYAYKEMDRAIFMNPDKVNSRLVIPVATYPQIMLGYKPDMVLYANNYEADVAEGNEVEFFDNVKDAERDFIRGARFAKGTTQEIGLSETFFANPFGPVQREEMTRPLIDSYFSQLYNEGVKIGVLHTRLAVPGMEHEGPAKAAAQLFKILEHK